MRVVGTYVCICPPVTDTLSSCYTSGQIQEYVPTTCMDAHFDTHGRCM